MRSLLIISPYFPPLNTADMHRIRISLPFFKDYGWKPQVLSVAPQYARGVRDPLLAQTIPADVPVVKTRAIPLSLSRWLGIGSLGLRALPFLYYQGLHLLRHQRFDLVYFSTTEFPTLILGRLWQMHTGTPYIFDIQDPWVSDYYEQHPQAKRPPKYALARRLHSLLEPWAMRDVAGLIAVSEPYINSLQQRYPPLKNRPAAVLPFGASPGDMALAARQMSERTAAPGVVCGVYVGRGGPDMQIALEIIFRALRLGLERNPTLFQQVRLEFTGTDYAPAEQAQKSVEPIAGAWGVKDQVAETPARVPYFGSLAKLLAADFLIIPGSDDPQYTASKIYPYILVKRPLLAVFHEASSAVEILNQTRAGTVVTFRSAADTAGAAERLYTAWRSLLAGLPFTPDTDWRAFEPYTAREMTRKQCELFARAVN